MQRSDSLQKDVTDSAKDLTGCVLSIYLQHTFISCCVLGELSPSQVQLKEGVHNMKKDTPCLAGIM